MIKGKWYAEGSAVQSNATLQTSDGKLFYIRIDEGATYAEPLALLQISDRLGNVERKITLPDGSIFVTSENDAIDELCKQTSNINGIIHRAESHLGWVAIALVVTVLSTFSFFKWGVPWTSQKIAHSLPQETNNIIAGNTFKFLDKYLFDDTELTPARIAQIRTHFNEKLVPLGDGGGKIKYKLHFRKWSDIPNALALPSGDIILTDKFVEISTSQDEIDAVLFHEMGHVVHRHSLEMVIESTFVTVAVMMITGDSSGLADMGIGLASLLVSSNYSRGHESEADLYAFKKLLVAKIDPAAFSTIMSRITSHMENKDKTPNKKADKDVVQNNKMKEKTSPLDYLSSHPSTQKRIEIARQYSDCFKKGLTVCKVAIPD